MKLKNSSVEFIRVWICRVSFNMCYFYPIIFEAKNHHENIFNLVVLNYVYNRPIIVNHTVSNSW